MIEQIFVSAILGIVEGFTEFLPISSTGHLILVNKLVGFTGVFANRFDVIIQLGAILAVVVLFWKKLAPFGARRKESFEIWGKVIVAVIPALVLGWLLGDFIEEKLFNTITVSISLFIGGVILLIIERRNRTAKINSIAQIGYRTAFVIGLIQCIAMIPGVSRAGATIVGAMLLGVSRQTSAEFSFFLAVPTLAAAAGYSFLKSGLGFTPDELLLLAVGFSVSFLVAAFVISGLIKYISRHNFTAFGYYRIVLALIVVFLL